MLLGAMKQEDIKKGLIERVEELLIETKSRRKNGGLFLDSKESETRMSVKSVII